MRIGLLLVFIGIVVILGSAFLLVFPNQEKTTNPSRPLTEDSETVTPVPKISIQAAPSPTVAAEKIVEPIAEFSKRITKKPFGIYITPQNSPVQPEKFTGYHTGVDVEYEDVLTDVPVMAIADGEVVLSRTASGYGGVMVIRQSIDNKEVFVLYGHLDPASMKKVNEHVKAGEKIAILGDGHTAETDGERKHLHFGIIKGNMVNLAGYVQDKDELENWYDPVEFLKNTIN